MSKDDIVARLRVGTQTPYGLPVQSDEARMHIDAADEITRLRADLAAERELLTQAASDANTSAAECENLRADLAAARALLEEARDKLCIAADDINDWGAHASAYLQEKHDLDGCKQSPRDTAARIIALLNGETQ